MASSTTQKRRQKTIDAQSRLKFRPAESKLAQALRDAATELDQGTATAHSVAATVTQAAKEAIPKLTAAVGQQQGLSDQLRAVAPALDPGSGFGKAAAVETQGAARRLGELKTNAVADYIGQQARARQGEAFQISNLQNRHAATVDRIGQQSVDLALQKGDYAAGLAGKYEDQDLQRAFSRAQQQRTFAQQDASREDSQAAQREAARLREANKPDKVDKEAAKHAERLRKRESALQRTFSQKVAEIGTWTYEKKNPRDPSTPLVLPVDKAWVAANRRSVMLKLRAASGGRSGTTLTPEMARRVVEAYLAVGDGDPGSFKRYRRGAAPAPPRLGGNPLTG